MCDTPAPYQTVASPVTIMGRKAVIDLRQYSDGRLKVLKPKAILSEAFHGMHITDASFMDEIDERTVCATCGKSRKYFCYTCHTAMSPIVDRVPQVSLPCQVDIIKHPREIDGKSTAVHAAVISPGNVRVFTYPNLPDYSTEMNVYLMFPAPNSQSLERLWCQFHEQPRDSLLNPEQHTSLISRVVFIDCTWNQTKRILNDDKIKLLPTIQLTKQETLFWRYQKGKPSTYLSTIEAIYYFSVEYHCKALQLNYNHEYDNLLFFFKFMFGKIHSLYDPNSLLAFKDI